MITDRIRFTVIQVNTDVILTRDLVVKEPEVLINLSGASRCAFKIDQGQRYGSSSGIDWKSWGQWIIPEVTTDTYGKICLGAQLVNETKIDPASGDLMVEATGFMGYPKGIPWQENFNPIAVDPAEVIQRIWAHLQSFPNANLGVQVLPADLGVEMLPGYGFDGNTLSFDFTALWVRAVDFQDSGDMITQLARDLPLDLFEEVTWNANRTAVNKVVRIAYPYGGVRQDYLAFRLGENVMSCELADELEIEPVSDVIIRSWLPGKTYTSKLSNADMTRARRTILEEAANIDSTERAAAWAKRKLTRRNIPKSFSKITIDPNHPNAPFGSFGLGDSILVEAQDYPWTGDISEWHRITSIMFKESEPFITLGTKVEGAFNYDPIIYDPNAIDQGVEDYNLLSNGYFSSSLSGWISRKGQWFRVATSGYTGDGSVRIDCDDNGEELESAKISINSGETLTIQAWVRCQSITKTGTPPYTFAVALNGYKNGGEVSRGTIVNSITREGTNGFSLISGTATMPTNGSINEISVSLLVNSSTTGGIAWWDDVKVLRP